MPKLVIVDGDAGRRRIARVIAEATGWDVDEVQSGAEAVETARREHAALVIALARPTRQTSEALRAMGTDLLLAPEDMADLITVLRDRRRRAD